MTFEELVAHVGEERYRAAREWAWRTAAGTGSTDAESWPDELAQVPHDLAAAVWYDDEIALAERLDLALRLYRDMPSYANTMDLSSFYNELRPDEKLAFWNAYRSALDSDDDRLADPIVYSLAVDFLEDPGLASEAWHEISRTDLAPWERRLERVLSVAAGLPWPLKEPTFERLAGNPSWHPILFRALVRNPFDADGQLNRRAAAARLKNLQLSDDAPDLATLRDRLAEP